VDEIATGSANLLDRRRQRRRSFFAAGRIAAVPHFRLPSIDPGVVAFIWGIVLGLYIYFGLLAVGQTKATAFVVAAVSAAAITLFVRLRGANR
jgi:hypothetical protein